MGSNGLQLNLLPRRFNPLTYCSAEPSVFLHMLAFAAWPNPACSRQSGTGTGLGNGARSQWEGRTRMTTGDEGTNWSLRNRQKKKLRRGRNPINSAEMNESQGDRLRTGQKQGENIQKQEGALTLHARLGVNAGLHNNVK